MLPMQLRHNIEVHPIHRSDKRGGHKYYRYDGKCFRDTAKADVSQTHVGILQKVEPAKAEVSVIEQRVYILQHYSFY